MEINLTPRECFVLEHLLFAALSMHHGYHMLAYDHIEAAVWCDGSIYIDTDSIKED